jgi:hypothetical protein
MDALLFVVGKRVILRARQADARESFHVRSRIPAFISFKLVQQLMQRYAPPRKQNSLF